MISIGENIRRLRRERDITQDELAELLGISAQAISGWECGRTAPDISLLAPLASIFEVSADVILGIDAERKEVRILELYGEAYDVAASGDHVRAVAMVKEALRLYPDSYLLMDFYANEIYLYNDMMPEETRELNQKRAFAYIDMVIAKCADPEIRNNSLIMACLWNAQLGNLNEAERLAKTQAGVHFTYGELMGRIYMGRRQFEAYRDDMLEKFTSAVAYILVDRLPEMKDDGGVDIYDDGEKIQLYQTAVEMFRLMFPDGDYNFHAKYLDNAYRSMAVIYARLGDKANVVRCLCGAAEMAVQFDLTPDDAVYTSLAVRGFKTEEVWWSDDGHNRCFDLAAFMAQDEFAFVMGEDEVKVALGEVEKVAR